MTTAAIFDIDGTIFRGSLMEAHYNELVEYGLIPLTTHVNDVLPLRKAHADRKLSYDSYLGKLVDVYTEALTTVKISNSEFAADQVIAKHGDQLYTYAERMIAQHKQSGHQIIFVSGSPTFLVSRLAEKLGADLWFGTDYLTKNGYYTGQVIPMWDSASKQFQLGRLVDNYGIDLGESYAYGDTNGDFGMLSKVGHPVAVNPSAELLTKLRESDFADDVTTLIERKDVVYEMPLRDIKTLN